MSDSISVYGFDECDVEQIRIISASPGLPQGVTKLDDLSDVSDADTAVPGQVLTRDLDGQWRPMAPLGGGSSGVSPLVWVQDIPATVWGPVMHGLNYNPASVALFNLDFSQQYGEFSVQHLGLFSLRISMDQPTAGIALIM